MDLAKIDLELEKKIAPAPRFFENAPLVIDVADCQEDQIDFPSLLNILRKHRLVPVGLKNGSLEQNTQAITAGFAIMQGGAVRSTSTEKSKVVETTASQNSAKQVAQPQSKVVLLPIRGGQQSYAPGGDLIVMAPVNSGAEILADGTIHVYAALRGRALAGIQGNQQARIFCTSFEAELVAIAGHYRVFEETIPEEIYCKPVQVYLQDEQLRIEPIKVFTA